MRIFQLFEREEQRLPKTVVTAFVKLGDAQRARPESAMLRVQEAAGGGVLAFVVEHVGDLTHRMSHMVGWSGQSAGFGYVADKVEKTLRMLTQKYGFEKEVAVNAKNNAEYRKVDLAEYQKKVDDALTKYADEHAKLVVYNRAQWLGREAAVMLGRQRYAKAITYLTELQKMLKTSKIWDSHALSYRLDEKGQPIPYKG